MMAHKQLLHQLLRRDQEPFHLKTYIADKRSQLNHSSSPAALRSPAISLYDPVTAAAVVEAAVRIRKQRPSKRIKNVGFGLFGSLVKVLKHRSKKRVLRNYETGDGGNLQEDIGVCGEFALPESRFCSSPLAAYRFSFRRSPASSGLCLPELSSPASSAMSHVKQEESSDIGDDSDNGNQVEAKEQCSPVSVLEANAGHEYEKIQRTLQLLNRLRRFEELSASDPIELEEKLLEFSDDQVQRRRLLLCRKQGLDTSSAQQSPRKANADTKRFDVSDVIAEEKTKTISSCSHEEFCIVNVMVGQHLREVEEMEAAAAEVELAIFWVLVEELSDELFCMDEHQELICESIECM